MPCMILSMVEARFSICLHFNFSFRLSIWGPGGQWIPFERCNRQEFFHFRVAFHRRLIFVGRQGFLPFHRFCSWVFRQSQWSSCRQSWFFLWGFWQRAACFVFKLMMKWDCSGRFLYDCNLIISYKTFYKMEFVR